MASFTEAMSPARADFSIGQINLKSDADEIIPADPLMAWIPSPTLNASHDSRASWIFRRFVETRVSNASINCRMTGVLFRNLAITAGKSQGADVGTSIVE